MIDITVIFIVALLCLILEVFLIFKFLQIANDVAKLRSMAESNHTDIDIAGRIMKLYMLGKREEAVALANQELDKALDRRIAQYRRFNYKADVKREWCVTVDNYKTIYSAMSAQMPGGYADFNFEELDNKISMPGR